MVGIMCVWLGAWWSRHPPPDRCRDVCTALWCTVQWSSGAVVAHTTVWHNIAQCWAVSAAGHGCDQSELLLLLWQSVVNIVTLLIGVPNNKDCSGAVSIQYWRSLPSVRDPHVYVDILYISIHVISCKSTWWTVNIEHCSAVVNEIGGRTQDSDKNILERMQIFILRIIAWVLQQHEERR